MCAALCIPALPGEQVLAGRHCTRPDMDGGHGMKRPCACVRACACLRVCFCVCGRVRARLRLQLHRPGSGRTARLASAGTGFALSEGGTSGKEDLGAQGCSETPLCEKQLLPEDDGSGTRAPPAPTHLPTHGALTMRNRSMYPQPSSDSDCSKDLRRSSGRTESHHTCEQGADDGQGHAQACVLHSRLLCGQAAEGAHLRQAVG